jgi:TonB family protein
MTLWVSNIAVYSVQLGVLVVAGSIIASMVRLYSPVAALRFWQGILAAAIMSPAYQLWANGAGPTSGAFGQVYAGIASLQSAAGPDDTFRFAPYAAAIVMATIAAGAAIRVTFIATGLLELRRVRASAQRAVSWTDVVEPLRAELGVRVDVRISDAVTSPATFGAWRPTILLPSRIETLGTDVQRAVLYHELLHVRRRDWVATLAEEFWCAVLWFHPAARVLAGELSVARETVVDQATLARTGDRRAYAAALLEFSTPAPRLVGAAGLIGRRGLERRVSLITNESPMLGRALALRLSIAALSVTAAVAATTRILPLSITAHAQADKVYTPGKASGVTFPQPIKEVKPAYTARAMQAKIQGTVWLKAVVLPSGDVGDVTVSRSLDPEHGLDEEAIRAMRQWKFKPGTKDGKAVAVEVTVEMTFTLKK